MAVTPTGIISLPLHRLKILLANCATFQSWTGAANAEAAKASIHLVAHTPSASDFPYALVHHGEEGGSSEAIAHGTRQFFIGSDESQVGIVFYDLVPDAYSDDDADAELYFTNYVGAVLSELRELSGVETESIVQIISRLEWEPPQREHPDDREAFGQVNIQAVRVTLGP